MAARHGRGPYLKSLRDAAFAQGLCYECTSRPVVFGRRRCDLCNERNRARLAAKFAAGECRGLCGAQRPAGHSRCDACRERHRQYMEARRRAAGAQPRVLREPGAPRPPRVRKARVRVISSTSAVPPARPVSPASAEPLTAEVDLSQRRAVIAALAARRAA